MTQDAQNPIEQAKVLQAAKRELSQDLLEQAHGIVLGLLELPANQHDRLGGYKPLLVPLLSQYLQHSRAFDFIEQNQDAQDLQAPLLTLTSALDRLALDVLGVVLQPLQAAQNPQS
jgi:hypothetical protein